MKVSLKVCVITSVIFCCSPIKAAEISHTELDKLPKMLVDKKRDAEILSLIDQLDKELDTLPKHATLSHQEGKESVVKGKEPIELLDQELMLEDNLEALELEKTLSSELQLIEEFTGQDDLESLPQKSSTKPFKGKDPQVEVFRDTEELIINTLDGSNLLNVEKELEKLEKKFHLKSPTKGLRIDEE